MQMDSLKKLNLEELFEREDLDFDNNGEVQYLVGLCYKNGKGTNIDNDAADEWFEKAKKNGYIIENKGAEEHIYNETEKIDYEQFSISELARLCIDGDEKAILLFAEKYDETLSDACHTLDNIKDDECEDYITIMKKYEILGNKALEEKNGKESNKYFQYALELNSKVAEHYLVDVYLTRTIDTIDELSMLKALSSRGNNKASYYLARAFFSYEIPVDMDKLKVALLLDDVINDEEMPSDMKKIAKGFMSILDKKYWADIHQIIIEEENKLKNTNMESDKTINSNSLDRTYVDTIGLEVLIKYESGEKINFDKETEVDVVNNNESNKGGTLDETLQKRKRKSKLTKKDLIDIIAYVTCTLIFAFILIKSSNNGWPIDLAMFNNSHYLDKDLAGFVLAIIVCLEVYLTVMICMHCASYKGKKLYGRVYASVIGLILTVIILNNLDLIAARNYIVPLLLIVPIIFIPFIIYASFAEK